RVLTPGSAQGKVISITRTPFLIGRDPKCQLRPGSPMVSGQHCALQVRQGKIFVTDAGSTNGTFVNEGRSEKEALLQNGGQLRTGRLVFAVNLETIPPVDQPTPLPPSRGRSDIVDDESVAAVLLAAQDEDGPLPGSATVDISGVPTGSTEVQSSSSDVP